MYTWPYIVPGTFQTLLCSISTGLIFFVTFQEAVAFEKGWSRSPKLRFWMSQLESWQLHKLQALQGPLLAWLQTEYVFDKWGLLKKANAIRGTSLGSKVKITWYGGMFDSFSIATRPSSGHDAIFLYYFC